MNGWLGGRDRRDLLREAADPCLKLPFHLAHTVPAQSQRPPIIRHQRPGGGGPCLHTTNPL